MSKKSYNAQIFFSDRKLPINGQTNTMLRKILVRGQANLRLISSIISGVPVVQPIVDYWRSGEFSDNAEEYLLQ